MKKFSILFLVVSAILIAGCSHSVVNTVKCVQLDPLEKVFTEESYFVENPDTAAVAKGETATFQFVVKSAYPIQGLKVEAGNLSNDDQKISATLKAFVGYIRAGNHANHRSKDATLPSSDYYPDCLQEVESIDVSPLHNQPIWVSYDIPRDVADGNYAATLVFTGKVSGKPFRITKQVNAKVYPVALPEQSLWVTNWLWDDFTRMNGNQPVEMYSDRYWELLTAIANVMRNHGQNTYVFFDWVGLCNIKCSGTQYSFDFTNFDKRVELLIREGGLKRIEGGHLGAKMGTDIGVFVPNTGGLYHMDVPLRQLDDDMTQNFLSQFLPALYSHLEKKGWTNMYVQHIADEPSASSVQSYIRIAEFVRQHMPGIPFIDAIGISNLTSGPDIWVPVLNTYHRDYVFYQERQAAGDEVWFYTCTSPQGNYANRFLEQPLIQTRYLHWINYRYGATGFLHWGGNYWYLGTTNDAAASNWPGGDAWIVYPAEGRIYSSIRLAAMRDGIADYELLKLLEQKSPKKAQQLAGRLIRDFDAYMSNVRLFRQIRLELLKLLSE